MKFLKLVDEERWRLGSLFVLILTEHVVSLNAEDSVCPSSDVIQPCRCSAKEEEVQIWCSYGGLTGVLETLKVLATRMQEPIDELILESNNLPSLPGRTFEGLHVTRLMLRDNGLERVTSNWLGTLENTLLELFIIEPRLRSFPSDALEHLRTLEAVTLQGGIIKRSPNFSGLRKLRYIQLHSPVLMDLTEDTFNNLPSLEQLHVIGSPLLNRLDVRVLNNLLKLKLLNISNCGLSWIHPKAMVNLPSLREVHLTMNRLSDAGVVGRSCRDLQNLQILKLENNFIDRLLEGSFVDLPSLRELYLSGNLIADIHRGAFRNTPSLKILDLSRNMLKKISPEAFMYPSGAVLEELWLMDNQLYQVNEMRSLFTSLSRLRFLDMSRNYMDEIPFEILQGHPTLERLHLDENQIKRLPKKSFTAMPALRELRLRNNSLSEISSGPSWNFPSLKGLDLSQNKFRRLDSRLLTYLPSLRSLDISENFIDTVLPDSFIGTLELETLNMSKNFITAFHSLTFTHLPKLFELDASWNRLREVMPGLPQNIEYLRLSNNQIFQLPSPPSQELELPSLRLLDVSGNSIQVVTQGTFESMGKLQWLYLHDNSLQKIDNGALNGLSRLELLNIKNNKIRDFTNNLLKGLKSLKQVHLDGNFIEVVGANAMSHNQKLEFLDLGRNQLSRIERGAFTNSRKLQELNLSHNALTKIPDAIQGLSMLESLDVSHNNIENLQPFSFDSLPSLAELRLGSNQIHDLQEGTFRDMPRLGFLDLDNNDIDMIAKGAIRSLPSLIAIRLSRNKLRSITEETMVDMPELQSAEFQSNQLTEIADNALVNVPHLALFNLSYNHLTGLERSGITELRSLEVLDMSHNQLSWVESRALYGMEWLVELKMDYNKICNINGAPFNSLPRLRVLTLRNNRMTTITESAFQRLRQNIAVLDIDGNPLSCSCKMAWLQAWLRDTATEGPRCADGSLFRDARLSRTECLNSRVVEPQIPGCETEFDSVLMDTPHSPLSALMVADNSTKDDSPTPNESEYFYDEYIEYEDMNGTDSVDNSTTNYVEISTSKSNSPLKADEPTASPHHVTGDTPTLYAAQAPKTNISNPGLGYEDLKNIQQKNKYNGITFFGIPLPSLSLGNLWKGSVGRSSENTRPGRVQFTGTRGREKPGGKSKIDRVEPIRSSPPAFQDGGFQPIMPSGNTFTPMLEGDSPVTEVGWGTKNTITDFPKNHIGESISEFKNIDNAIEKHQSANETNLPQSNEVIHSVNQALQKQQFENWLRSLIPPNNTFPQAVMNDTMGRTYHDTSFDQQSLELKDSTTKSNINAGVIEPLLVKRKGIASVEEEVFTTTETIPPVTQENFLSQVYTGVALNPKDVYQLQNDQFQAISSRTRFLTGIQIENDLDPGFNFKTTTEEHDLFYLNEVKPNLKQDTEPSQNNWYFENYNKSNLQLQPFVGSGSVCMFSHGTQMLLLSTVILVFT